MESITLKLPPGVANEASRVRNTANWREVNLVRWDDGTLRPINGWDGTAYGPFASFLRQIHKWSDNAGNEYIAFLCEEHLYVQSPGGFSDITPVGGITGVATTEAGYGEYLYSYGDYGTPRPGQSSVEAVTPIYSLDNWGVKLRAMTSNDGRLLGWDPATPATPAVAVTNAPINNRFFIVTPERHIMLFDTAGIRGRFAWSDQEDDTDWNYADVASAAGFLDIEPRSPIICAEFSPNGIFAISKNQVIDIEYVGSPDFYGFTRKGKFPEPISPDAIAETPDGPMWLSQSGFWVYNGVSVIPVVCDIWDWINSSIDFGASRLLAAAVISDRQSEVWYSFATTGSTTANRTAIWDYRDRVWTMARMGRVCGYGYPNDQHPLMSNGEKVYQHEMNGTYADYDELPWAETHVLNVKGGQNMITVHTILPEVIGDRNGMTFQVIRSSKRVDSPEVYSDPRSIRKGGFVDLRTTGRDVRLRVNAITGTGWNFGDTLLKYTPRGEQ